MVAGWLWLQVLAGKGEEGRLAGVAGKGWLDGGGEVAEAGGWRVVGGRCCWILRGQPQTARTRRNAMKREPCRTQPPLNRTAPKRPLREQKRTEWNRVLPEDWAFWEYLSRRRRSLGHGRFQLYRPKGSMSVCSIDLGHKGVPIYLL